MTPHPSDPGFAAAYGKAWSSDPGGLVKFFDPKGSYADVAMGGTYRGHDEITRFHRFMLKFAPDSLIEFGDTYATNGRLTSLWVWSGTVSGPLKLRSGKLVDLASTRFSVPGVAVCTFGEDGKLLSHDDYWDLATVLDQAAVPVG
ncbi:nuclear transport factor 2 family protein [Saccharopolyspora terrae]|uniref:Nuclear transport factor 2 family protein n=1 Tax=Saccharopolyspora terrae TaxID=2530384 RepID=A0A4V2Y9C4_9PSEU|nr:nuclear transport factor 2 family protein [Saccharopolyspora terrae]TDC99375.1 nuclear transport factor 2 family protein [Saccharopolyspora terrae]